MAPLVMCHGSQSWGNKGHINPARRSYSRPWVPFAQRRQRKARSRAANNWRTRGPGFMDIGLRIMAITIEEMLYLLNLTGTELVNSKASQRVGRQPVD